MLKEGNIAGAFKRSVTAFHDIVQVGGKFPPASGRYHLYVSLACPWACRCLAVRSLLGLEEAISVSYVHPTWMKTRPDEPEDTHAGWVFRSESEEPIANPAGKGSFPGHGSTIDHILGKSTVREVYEAVDSGYSGTRSVPILFDKETTTIVNNESAEIIEILATGFADFHKDAAADVDLFPKGEAVEADVKEIDERVYHGLNNGVYRSGFAKTQEAFDVAVADVFDTLDWLEARLAKSRYLLGDKISASDIRAYVTLVRFDPVYVVYFKCSKKMIREYPNLFAYTRDLYQHPRIKPTTNLKHIVAHYFSSHPTLNAYAILPPCGTDLELPHDRATRDYSAVQA